ncbi:neutral zinc metallopeptidase [Arthrobacter sp. zg-Y179]|uniref:neutral zinc metallopeptidase n=1 Tax=Arthrobacter sp. zg-Y179 TaxID=2894188 RepID=UPI001E3F6058|nr:neutral zinc metallopeptidase [Arthrobacter sp. zg-Y179]MCC9173238.1 neutral zinc metallopeptidase [Arthrobacter sp. zg-Y179]
MAGETKNRWSALLGLLLAATLTLSGCGSSGETDSPPGNQAGGGDSAEKDSGTSENDVGGGGGDDTSTEQAQGQTPPGNSQGNDSQGDQTLPGNGSGNGGPGGGGDDQSENTEPADPNALTSEELVADMETAQKITDQFWRTHWREFFAGRYTSPTVVGLYDGRDPSSAPTCAGEPLASENAFYCPPEDYVAWDLSLMARGFEFGDAWPYLVIAHEWGHAIANRLDASLRFQAGELQADCLAGATLFGAAADGTIAFEKGDQEELVTSLSSLGGDIPWTDTEDHGDSFERVENFNVGRTKGVLACFPSQ